MLYMYLNWCLYFADSLVHVQDSKHIVVYHKGRYFKVYIHYKGKLLMPCQIEM